MSKKEHQKNYLEEAKQKILEHKYLESEKAGHDLGQAAVKDWIEKYAKIHRREYVEKRLEKAKGAARSALGSIKSDTSIPQELVKLLEGIFDTIYECVDDAEDTMEINGNGSAIQEGQKETPEDKLKSS
jgi:hypothetical protein